MARPVRPFPRFLRLEELETRDVPASASLFTDDFNRPGDTTLGANWTTFIGNLGVASNASTSSATLVNFALVNGVQIGNGAVEADVTVPAGAAAALVARHSITAQGTSYYYADIYNTGSGSVARMFRYENGAPIPLFQQTAPSNSGTLRFELVGSSLKLFLNGALVGFAQDTRIASGGVGMSLYNPNVTLDNFRVTQINPTNTPLSFADAFNVPVNAQLNNETWIERTGNFRVAGNNATGNSSGLSLATLSGLNRTDVAVDAFVNVATPGQSSGLVARYSGFAGTGTGDANYYTGLLFNNNGVISAQIWRNLNGQYALLSSQTVPSTGGNLRFEVVGTSLKLFQFDTLVGFAYDTALTSGSVGMRANSSGRFSLFGASGVNVQAQSLPFSDDFNTTDRGQLNTGAWTNRIGNIRVENSEITSTAPFSLATLNEVNEANVAVQAIVSVPTPGETSQLVARHGSTGYYTADLHNYLGTPYARLYRTLNGSTILLNQVVAPANGGILRFEARGPNLKLFLGGNLLVSAQDGALTTGSVGVASILGGNLDDFSATTLTTTTNTLPFGDDFSTPLSGGLNDSWTDQTGSIRIESGEATSTGTALSLATLNGVNQANVALQAIVSVPTPGETSQLIARYNGSTGYYSADLHNYLGTPYARLYRTLNGATTLLSQTVASANGGLLRFEVSGTSLKLFLEGTLVVAANDPSLGTGGIGIASIAGGNMDGFFATPLTVDPQFLTFNESFSSPGQLNSAAWTNIQGIIQVNGGLASNAASTVAVATLNGLNEANVAVQANVTTSLGRSAGLVLRSGATGYYIADIVGAGPNEFRARIQRVQGTSFTLLSSQLVPFGAGTLRFEASGISLKLFLDGNMIGNTIDSAHSTGSVGITSFNSGTVDDFSAAPIATANVAAPFTDLFSTATNKQLNPLHWTNQQGLLQVEAGTAAGLANIGYSIARINGLNAANVTVQADVDAAARQASGLVLRYTDANNYYYADLVGGASPRARIYRVFGGSLSFLSDVAAPTATGTMRFEAVGTSLFLFLNGNAVGTASNQTALPTGGVGIISFNGGKLDNFSVS